MNVKTWTVCLIEPNKFEGQIILDLLRNAGVDRVRVFTNPDEAMDALKIYKANIIISSFELPVGDGAIWTRLFRRDRGLANRQAAVFITSGAFSRAMAEECRHAGCNALIGKPISGKVLLATINKVLGSPRPFIDAEGYVGPCRRAGIVTAGAPKRRRKADGTAGETKAPSADMLQLAIQALNAAAAQFLTDPKQPRDCETALRAVQAYAVSAGDGPLMRACAAFALQISSARTQPAEVAKAALEACVNGVTSLASAQRSDIREREAMAEAVRQAVAKAAMQRAA
ncbi:MAG TPA: response regulator [Vitreimonas sp.]|uniref:response regulator n=1 Tax=Vitreimonas sp. TaxID=3069702 RepID=UPI002D5AE726|nr:response regulator [Vitreimonas sp.]HYD85943.1 response regulator [Vitreimonas sp.]